MEERKDYTIFYCIIIELSNGFLLCESNFCFSEIEYGQMLLNSKRLGQIKKEIKLDQEQLKELNSKSIDSMRSMASILVAFINTHIAIKEKAASETTLRRCAN